MAKTTNQVEKLHKIIELQTLAKEEIKNGSIEMGKAMLKKVQELIREMESGQTDENKDAA